MRNCKECGETKPLKYFGVYNKERGLRRHRCNTCYAKYHVVWRKGQGERYRTISRKRFHKRIANMSEIDRKLWYAEKAQKKRLSHYKNRHAVFMAYGGYRCACCGETEETFLTIDHINNDGAEMRRNKIHGHGFQFYAWLRRNNYPVGFQVLCMNCQYGKLRNNGICPHQLTRNDYSVKEVGINIPKRSTSKIMDDDIVCSSWKHEAATSVAGNN